METLRQEILESQKARSDFLKWKLVVVAGLGAAGMGFTSGGYRYGHVVLCFIPFACIYVDLLCRHLSLRIFIIGQFIKSEKPEDVNAQYVHLYERFSDRLSYAFTLEAWDLHWSTIAISICIAPIGWAIQSSDKDASITAFLAWLFGLSGVLGILLSLWGKKLYENKREKIIADSENILQEIKTRERSNA